MLRNALLNLVRSKGRTILIGLIVAVIATASCIALSVRDAAKSAAETQLAATEITGTIGIDRSQLFGQPGTDSSAEMPSQDEMRERLQHAQSLTLDQLQALADNENVSQLRYSDSTSMDLSGDLEAVGAEEATSDQTSEITDPQMPGGMPGGMGGFGLFASGDVTLTGYADEDSMTAFVAGTSAITDGELFDLSAADNQVLINSEFATYNSIGVGGAITVVNPNATEETYELIVSGIYTNSAAETSPMRFSTAQDPANQLYLSQASLSAIVANSEAAATTSTDETTGMETTTALMSQVSATFVFANKAAYDAYSAALPALLEAQGLSTDYTITSADVANYESSILPLQNLEKFATTLLWIVLGVGALVLVGIAIFNIRERKYEVGVLTAIGVRKPKVAMQYVTESVVIALLASIVGLGVGVAASPSVANNLLADQIASIEAEQSNTEQNFGRPGGIPGDMPGGEIPGGSGMPGGFGGFGGGDVIEGLQNSTNYIDQVSATVNPQIIVQLLGIGIALSVIASMASVIFVMRFEPLRILADRS
ncbi:MAG: ABC transporter permease [Propionibacteriaceae bacterium]|nr:ABC transporter permease [Propionibacteriaceae bacterium]